MKKLKKLKQTRYISGDGKYRFFVDEKKRNVWPKLIALGLILVLLTIFTGVGLGKGYSLKLAEISVECSQLPESFDGFKILQITDIHGCELGAQQEKIKKLLQDVDYDIVIFTGDYTKNSEDTDYWALRDIMSCLKDVPVYYILGDNDYTPANASETSDKWKMCIDPEEKTAFQLFFEEEYNAKFIYPIQMIENEEGDRIFLTGIYYDKDTMNALDFDPEVDFSITVTHKPINYNVTRRLKDANKRTITEIDYDLSISGHTCGGQYRIPIMGAVYDSEEGWFPQEEDLVGLSSDGDGRYNYISAGIGVDSGFRFYDNPEISLIELKCGETENEQ